MNDLGLLFKFLLIGFSLGIVFLILVFLGVFLWVKFLQS